MKKNYLVLSLGAVVLVIFGQNCQQNGGLQTIEESAYHGSTDQASQGGDGSGPSGDPTATTHFGKSILNFDQIYQSMINLSGLPATTKSMDDTYKAMDGAMPEGSDPKLINGAVMLAVTSVSGEICNGMIDGRANLANTQKAFFAPINFGAGPNSLPEATYLSFTGAMGNSLFGRAMSAAETELFRKYYQEFVAALTTAEKGQSAQTKKLILSTCSALMSSFDTMSF